MKISDITITYKTDTININSVASSDCHLIALVNKAIIHHRVNIESLQKVFLDEIILSYQNIDMLFDSSIAIQDKKHYELQGNLIIYEKGVMNVYSIRFTAKLVDYRNITKISDDLFAIKNIEIHIPYCSDFEAEIME